MDLNYTWRRCTVNILSNGFATSIGHVHVYLILSRPVPRTVLTSRAGKHAVHHQWRGYPGLRLLAWWSAGVKPWRMGWRRWERRWQSGRHVGVRGRMRADRSSGRAQGESLASRRRLWAPFLSLEATSTHSSIATLGFFGWKSNLVLGLAMTTQWHRGSSWMHRHEDSCGCSAGIVRDVGTFLPTVRVKPPGSDNGIPERLKNA